MQVTFLGCATSADKIPGLCGIDDSSLDFPIPVFPLHKIPSLTSVARSVHNVFHDLQKGHKEVQRLDLSPSEHAHISGA